MRRGGKQTFFTYCNELKFEYNEFIWVDFNEENRKVYFEKLEETNRKAGVDALQLYKKLMKSFRKESPFSKECYTKQHKLLMANVMAKVNFISK